MGALFNALEKHPNVTCHVGHKATAINQSETKATVDFENGKSATYKEIVHTV